MEAGDAGGVVPGQCSRSVPTSTCARRVLPVGGAKLEGQAQGPPFRPGEQPGKGKTGVRHEGARVEWLRRSEDLRLEVT